MTRSNQNTKPALMFRSTLFAILLLTGCTTRTVGPKDVATTPAASNPLDWSDWALTLSRGVENDLVNYQKLSANHEPLDRYLALLSRTGPGLTPQAFTTRDAKLAFYINAHNAAVVAGVLELTRKGKLPGRLPGSFEIHAIRVDGRPMSIAALRDRVLTLAGDDWRPRLALYQGKVVGPALDKHIYLPDMLDARLTQTAKAMLASRRIVRIEHGELKRLLLWNSLYSARGALISEYDRGIPPQDVSLVSALLVRADADERFYLNSAIGYDVAPMPDDRTIDAVVAAKE
jgi:hypothetical protein